ncbi:MAG: hypothetical protein WBC85_06000 [Planktotalea sp.]|uniref:alpha/beta hydrolase family protein n=1 Tax=Planktotalea sp. TaxID=2029877 RepID=UPI003C70B103
MTLRTTITRTAIALGSGAALFIGAAWLMSSETRPIPDTDVGFTTLSFEVDHRNKALDLHIWYPTDAQGPAALIAQNALFYGFHAHADAAPREGKHPLVVFSHGSGGRMTQMGWLASALAEQGFIVAGVNHHGTTSMDSDPHRTIEIWDRPMDLSAVLDAFEAGAISGIQADMGNVTGAGFSLGGHTALALSGARVSKAAYIDYCDAHVGMLDCGWMTAGGVDFNDIDAARYEASFADPRITASFAIDPALPAAMTRDSLAAIATPTLLINLSNPGAIPAGVDASQLVGPMQNAEQITVAGSWHMSAIAECSMLGRVIIGVSGMFTGETNICGQAERRRTAVHAEMLEHILPFMARNAM